MRMATPAPIVRPLEPADREAVRQLCGDTADGGNPIERVFAERRLVVDCLTRYYTDFNRSCCWVADAGGLLAGYVLAAADTLAADRLTRRRVVPGALTRAILRGVLFRAETWRMVRSLAANVRVLALRQADLVGYPAHIHLNTAAPFRGQGLGGSLLEAALGSLRQARAAGVHASVRADLASACRFFESHGFAVVRRDRLVFPVKGGTTPREVLLYARSLVRHA